MVNLKLKLFEVCEEDIPGTKQAASGRRRRCCNGRHGRDEHHYNPLKGCRQMKKLAVVEGLDSWFPESTGYFKMLMINIARSSMELLTVPEVPVFIFFYFFYF